MYLSFRIKLIIMSYDLIIAATFVVVYIFSYTFYRRKIISKTMHFRIWNLIFLIIFLSTAIMGLALAVVTDLGSFVDLDPNFNIVHMEAGLAFFILMIFHLFSNSASFKKLLSGGKKTDYNR